MDVNKNIELLEKIVCGIIIMIIAVISCLFIKGDSPNGNYLNEIAELTDEWHIEGENDISLPQDRDIEEGGALRISRIIDKDFIDYYPVISISTYYCDLNVYINDELIYHYEPQKNGIGRTDGRTIQFVELKSSCTDFNQELTIEYIPEIKINSYVIKAPVAGEKGDIFVYYAHKGILNSFVIGMLMFIGMLLIYAHLVIRKKIKDEIEFLNMGIFLMLCGIYLACQNEWGYIILQNYRLIYIAKCTSLAAIGLPITFILYRVDEIKKNKICGIIIISNILNFVVQAALYCLNLRELRLMLIYTHITLYGSSFIAIPAIIKAKENYKFKRNIIALVLGGLLEIGLFYVKHIDIGKCIKLTCLAFIMLQASYQFERYKKLYDEIQENQFYQKLAYIDILTGINNRNSFENDISEIEKNKEKYNSIECAVIDLNGLKSVNDAHGHMAGDELIRNFGSILKKCLDLNNRFYRVGGDEFVIIFTDVSREKVNEMLQKIHENTEEYNLKADIKLKYSIGISEYNNKEYMTIKKMISEADEIMYRNKVESRLCHT